MEQIVMFIEPELNKYFSTKLPLFEQFMSLKGEVFRRQKGRLTQRIKLGDKQYFIKQHFGVGWREIFKNLLSLRLPVISARNEWRAILALQKIHVPVPKLIAYGVNGWNPAKQQSFILMQELHPVLSLEELGIEWQTVPPSFKFKYDIIKEVARITKLMHDAGINHRDCYLCHYLLATNKKHVKLYLLDLHRAQIRKKIPVRWLIKDLAGLYFSSLDFCYTKRDYLRFIRLYRNKSLKEIFREEKDFWQAVKLRGDKLYREHNSKYAND